MLTLKPGGEDPGEGTPIEKGEVCSSYLLGVKKAFLVPPRVFSFKRSRLGAFAVTFRVFTQKNITEDYVLP